MRRPEDFGITDYNKEKFKKTKILDVNCSVFIGTWKLKKASISIWRNSR
jgi:hypothetical protein